MANFDPKLLAPAAQNADANKRTTKDVALANIEKMKEQLKAGDKAEGKVNFRKVGDKMEFSIRVGGSPLALEVFVNDKAATSEKPSVPAQHFVAALDHYAAQIKEGKYDEALKAADGKRAERTDKMRATRAAKPKVEKAAK